MDNAAIVCDEIIVIWEAKGKRHDKETKKKFNKARAACKTQNFYILLALFLINIALLIAVSIYCYLIKYQE